MAKGSGNGNGYFCGGDLKSQDDLVMLAESFQRSFESFADRLDKRLDELYAKQLDVIDVVRSPHIPVESPHNSPRTPSTVRPTPGSSARSPPRSSPRGASFNGGVSSMMQARVQGVQAEFPLSMQSTIAVDRRDDSRGRDDISPSLPMSPRSPRESEQGVITLVPTISKSVTFETRAEDEKSEGNSREEEEAVNSTPMTKIQSLPSRRLSARFYQLWITLNDPSSGKIATAYHYLMPFLQLLMVVPAIVQTLVTTAEPASIIVENGSVAQEVISFLEYTLEAVYIIDLVLRFTACPDRAEYMFNPYNIIDVIALCFLPVRIIYRTSSPSRDLALSGQEYILFCIVPILRMLACLRHFELLLLMFGACREAGKALPVLIFVWGLFILILSSLVYICETRVNVPSLPHAIWLVCVTWSTTGYGDVVPESVMGTVVMGATMFFGVLYMAIPIGLISQVFGDMWKQRDRILFLKRLRKSLLLRGIRPDDIVPLFREFDGNDSGAIDFCEWNELMDALHMVHRATDRACGFHYFAMDDVHVTPRRFVHVVWPEVYHEIFGLKRQSFRHNKLRMSLLNGLYGEANAPDQLKPAVKRTSSSASLTSSLCKVLTGSTVTPSGNQRSSRASF